MDLEEWEFARKVTDLINRTGQACFNIVPKETFNLLSNFVVRDELDTIYRIKGEEAFELLRHLQEDLRLTYYVDYSSNTICFKKQS